MNHLRLLNGNTAENAYFSQGYLQELKHILELQLPSIKIIDLLCAKKTDSSYISDFAQLGQFDLYKKNINSTFFKIILQNSSIEPKEIFKLLEQINEPTKNIFKCMLDSKNNNAFITLINYLEKSQVPLARKKKLLTDYAKHIRSQSAQQAGSTQSMDDETVCGEPQGPLRQTETNKRITTFLKWLAAANDTKLNTAITIDINTNEEYEVTITDGVNSDNFNLSILLVNATFTHLTPLTPEEITKLSVLLNKLIAPWHPLKPAPVSSDSIFAKLSALERQAIYYYTLATPSLHLYSNRLFYGEPLPPTSLPLTHAILIGFILGYLVSYVLNKLPELFLENAASDTDDMPNDKVELTDNYRVLPFDTEHLPTPRVNWIGTFPALTSVSANNNQFKLYKSRERLGRCMVFQTARQSLPVIAPISNFPYEQEAIYPPGQQFRITKIENGVTFFRPISSPQYHHDHYFSQHALCWTYRYLNQPFKDQSDSRMICGYTLHRPNHGIVHTARVMKLIEVVVEFIKNHTNNIRLADFCKFLSPDNLEWLRIIAAFSVTGRQSETSFASNKAKYMEYRDKCVEYFVEYIEQGKHPILNELLKLNLIEALRKMGAPEIIKTNFYCVILSIAHKLDLFRCYSSHEMTRALSDVMSIIDLKSPPTRIAWAKVMDYAIDLIDVTGDVRSAGHSNGEIINCSNRDYQKIFVKLNLPNSARLLMRYLDSIPLPTLILNDHQMHNNLKKS